LRQLHGSNAISVYPYQIGDGNEEAIDSGAFWFYRKMGFRSMDPRLEKLAQAEDRKIQARPGYRTPAGTLRRLSKAHVVYETPAAKPGAWDRFTMRNIGYRVQRRMAREFGGDAEAMSKACADRLASVLGLRPDRIAVRERTAFTDFAMVSGLDHDFAQWTPDEKAALRAIISAKSEVSELRYMSLLQMHSRLRRTILRLGF